jgi:hypothetical protein
MALLIPPTGITVEVRTSAIDILWFSIRDNNVAYNVYRSTESGGGASGYVKLTNILYDNPIKIEEEIVKREEDISETGNVLADPESPEFLKRTSVFTDTIKFNEIQKYSDEGLDTNTTYYYVITSVDITTGEESFYSQEVNAIPLAIPASPTIPKRTKQAIIEEMVTNWLEKQPDADLKPGSVLRDTTIDFPSRQYERLYTLERFRIIAQSFITLLSFDDKNTDGLSDPVADDPDKLALKEAFGFGSDAVTQEFIDSAFDNLSANNNTIREGSKKAVGTATFFSESAFTTDIQIPIGTVVGTLTEQPILFETLTNAVMFASISDTYFNASKNRYETKVPIRSIETGDENNVSAGTIRQIVSTLISQVSVKVENEVSTRDGLDKESNRNLAERAMLAVAGADPGTDNGYRKTMSSVGGIIKTSVVGAGHELMHRDYDDLRHKHIGGKVDLYLRGEELTDVTENFEVIYRESELIQATIINAVGMRLQSSELTLNEDDNFIIKITRVFNQSQNLNYDITNAYIVNYNTIDLDESLTLNAANPIVISDVIKISYVRSQINPYIPDTQPIRSLSTLTTQDINGDSVSFIELQDETPIEAELVSIDGTSLVLRSKDSNLTAEGNYITKVIRAYNGTTGQELVITPVTNKPVIIDYNKIQLVTGVINVPNNLRLSHTYFIVYETSGILEPSYKLSKDDDPLLDGNSVEETSNVFLYRNSGANSKDVDGNITGLVRATLLIPAISGFYGFVPEDTTLTLSGSTPNYIVKVLRVYNETRGENYSLSGYQIREGNKILIPTINVTGSIGISSTDIIKVGYNTSTSNPYHGYVANVESDVVLTGADEIELDFVGIDENTIVVESQSSLLFDEDVDYLVIPGSSYIDTNSVSEPVKLQRIPSGRISTTEQLVVSYNRLPNISVSYLINRLVGIAQEKVSVSRYITADVRAKEANSVQLIIEANVTFKPDVDTESGKTTIQGKIASFLASLPNGEDVAQSDVIGVIENLKDIVRKVEVPLKSLYKADGNQIVSEQLPVNYYIENGTLVGEIDGANITFVTEIKPVVTSRGLGVYSYLPRDVVVKINNIPTTVGSVDGASGVIKLAVFEEIDFSLSDQLNGLNGSAGSATPYYSRKSPVVDADGLPSTDIADIDIKVNGVVVDVVSLQSPNYGEFIIDGVVAKVTLEALGIGDGVTDTFAVQNVPMVIFSSGEIGSLTAADVQVYVDSVLQTFGVDYTANAVTGDIIFSLAAIPATGETIEITYYRYVVPAVDEEVGTGNGSRTIFTVSYGPFVDRTGAVATLDSDVVVKIAGVVQTPTVDYVIDDAIAGSIEFSVPPVAGDEVTITYKRLPNRLAGDTIAATFSYTDPPKVGDTITATYYTNLFTPVTSATSDSFVAIGGAETFSLSSFVIGITDTTTTASFAKVIINESLLTERVLRPDTYTITETLSNSEINVLSIANLLAGDTVNIYYNEIPAFTPGGFVYYKTIAPSLQNKTGENGGDEFQFRSVYQQSVALDFTTSSLLTGFGQAYIDSPNNDVFVSLSYNTSNDPNIFKWYVTYVVEGESGTRDIDLQDLEYPDPDNSSIFIYKV